MDCCPKNIVVRKDRKVGVIDFELSSWAGDPAYDLGFLIGHYLIHAIQQNFPETALRTIDGSIQAYCNEVNGMILQRNILKRVVKFSAVTIIYRIAGASRLSYINPVSIPNLLKNAMNLLCSNIEGESDKVITQMADVLA